jgi:hypothetical protein
MAQEPHAKHGGQMVTTLRTTRQLTTTTREFRLRGQTAAIGNLLIYRGNRRRERRSHPVDAIRYLLAAPDHSLKCRRPPPAEPVPCRCRDGLSRSLSFEIWAVERASRLAEARSATKVIQAHADRSVDCVHADGVGIFRLVPWMWHHSTHSPAHR